MKKGERPEFSAGWWRDSQPKGLKSAAELGGALRDYESARGKLKSTGKAHDADDASEALDDIKKAVKAVIAEASKAKGNAEMEATADCLKKFDRGCAQESKWIDEHTGGSGGSDFATPDAYQAYLVAALKRLRSSGEMNFGFVLGKTAEAHRLALHRSKEARTLAMTLVKETGLHQMTFGTARPAKDKAGVLVLTLEGKQLPGMEKKGDLMLRKFTPLPFHKMALVADGKATEGPDDPDDTATGDARRSGAAPPVKSEKPG